MACKGCGTKILATTGKKECPQGQVPVRYVGETTKNLVGRNKYVYRKRRPGQEFCVFAGDEDIDGLIVV